MKKLTKPQFAFLISIYKGAVERNSVHTIGNTLNKLGLLNYSYPKRQWYVTAAGIEQISKGEE
ncbi:hypothetical protein [Pseudescherichia sp.]|uniref:hypothetical protein n=1 Tax=Pseudescherichia sp. TaxID=2055881 RepID=UPI00289CF33B|nr:hypothetical protein [Pseudescherichia sp.]